MPKKITNFTEPINPENSLSALIASNQELAEEVRKLTKKVSWYLLITQIKAIFWVLVIIASVIASVIYLPPLIKNFLGPYQKLISTTEPLGNINSYLPK